MQLIRVSRAAAIGIVAVLTSITAIRLSGQAGDPLVEAARREGKLVVYIATSAPLLALQKSAFEKKYPFITLEFVNDPQITTRFSLAPLGWEWLPTLLIRMLRGSG
jgi:hypothetical protein